MRVVGWWLLLSVALVSCSWDKEKATAGRAAATDGVPVVRPNPAVAPSPPSGTRPAAAPYLPGGLSCKGLISPKMLEAITDRKTELRPVPEPLGAGKNLVRCENRTPRIEESFGYYVECGKQVRKAYAALRRRVGRKARTRRGPWRHGFASKGGFSFLSDDRRCYGQVVGRLLLGRPRLGERLAAEIARNLSP